PQGVGPPASGVTDFRDVTGGVYKARERIHRSVADLRLLATPTISRRASDLPLLVRKGRTLPRSDCRQRNLLHPIHRVAAFDRNRWPLSLGLGGRFPSESVAALARIPHRYSRAVPFLSNS